MGHCCLQTGSFRTLARDPILWALAQCVDRLNGLVEAFQVPLIRGAEDLLGDPTEHALASEW